jgi:hypothetical protein
MNQGNDGQSAVIWQQALDLVVSDKAPIAHDSLIIVICSLWVTVELVAYIPMAATTWSFIVSIFVNINLYINPIFLYAAALKTIVHVIQTRNSSSIHIMTMITNTVNGAIWFFMVSLQRDIIFGPYPMVRKISVDSAYYMKVFLFLWRIVFSHRE